MKFPFFLLQSVTVGGLGLLFFAVPAFALLVGLVWTYRRTAPVPFPKFSILAVLPALWIFVGLWGSHFWLEWERVPVERNPSWVLYPINSGIVVFVVLSAVLVFYLREARWFVFLFAILNFYFMLAMTMLAGMAVTGDWL